jgi:uncharacterized protein YqgC (DUF456 family)
MEWIMLLIAAIVIIVGIGGCVLPVIPGPPIAFVGLLITHFTAQEYRFTIATLIIYGVLAAAITVLDFLVPAWGTKKFGGTKYGSWGSTIGLLLVVFFIPIPFVGPILGIIIAPFLGAVIGEKIGGMETNKALKAGFGSFIGFLTGTLLKLVYCFVVLGAFLGKIGWLPWFN